MQKWYLLDREPPAAKRGYYLQTNEGRFSVISEHRDRTSFVRALESLPPGMKIRIRWERYEGNPKCFPITIDGTDIRYSECDGHYHCYCNRVVVNTDKVT